MENDDDFDQLVSLHDRIKDFRIKVAQKVLLNFYKEVPNSKSIDSPKLAKFTKVGDYDKGNDVFKDERLNLSSSTVCAYTLGEYLELWAETNQRVVPDNFLNLANYWNYIVRGLAEPVKREFQLLDEFSILNVLSLLIKIERRIEASTLGNMLTEDEVKTINDFSKYFAKNKKEVFHIVEALCRRFILNQLSSSEKGIHPIIFFKFLIILEDWKPLLDEYSREELNQAIDNKYKFRKIMPRYELKDGYYNWFLDEIYLKGKYELYRQISLYSVQERTIFDVKKLIYSLLVVIRNHRYQNTKIIDEALRIIFAEQYNTGLLPIGMVVNNEFVKKNNLKCGLNHVEFENREIGTSPIISSFECFNDILSADAIREDLKRYYKKFELAFNWALMRIRKTSPNYYFLGWIPEYESTSVPESWFSAHVLLFLKEYGELLSEIISDSSINWLQSKKNWEGRLK